MLWVVTADSSGVVEAVGTAGSFGVVGVVTADSFGVVGAVVTADSSGVMGVVVTADSSGVMGVVITADSCGVMRLRCRDRSVFCSGAVDQFMYRLQHNIGASSCYSLSKITCISRTFVSRHQFSLVP